MKWTNANSPVTFSQYDGIFTLDTSAKPNNTYTTTASQNTFLFPQTDVSCFI
ncbi:MAG: hypothetical protein R3A12_02455 [Ignavibacteria bacterium]